MKYLISNEQDMQDLAGTVLSSLGSARVLALSGDLGAGKTTFTKALAKELGIIEHVTSPTFVIQKSYECPRSLLGQKCGDFRKLVHIDAYRLESGGGAEVLDLQNTLQDKGNVVVIEWAENIRSALPKDSLQIHFKYKDETTREVVISGTMASNDKSTQE